MIDFESPSSKEAIVTLEDGDTRRDLLKFAIRLVQVEADGEDLLSSAMACVCDPEEGRPWDRSTGSFGTHIRVVMRDLARRDRKSARLRRAAVSDTDVDPAQSQTVVPAGEADRIAALSDEEFEREMREMPDPSRVPSVKEILGRTGARTTVSTLPPRPKKVPLVVWLIAAALGMLAIVFVLERPYTVAGRRREPAGPSSPDPGTALAPVDRARQLRAEGVGACEQALFAACEERLDEAKRLDPEGENDPVAQRARKSVREALKPDAPGL